MVDQLGGTLDAGIADLAYFFGVKLLPPLLVEVVVELANELGVNEVDESVSDVALILNKGGFTR